jgi:hypothetical protein
MPNTVVTDAINIKGGRNVRLVGGYIKSANTKPSPCGVDGQRGMCPNTPLKTAIRFNTNRSLTIEGTHIDVHGIGQDAIHSRNPADGGNAPRTFYMRNLIIEGFTGIHAGTHADAFHTQSRMGPIDMYVENVTVRSGYNSLTLQGLNTGIAALRIRNFDFAQDQRFNNGQLECWPKKYSKSSHSNCGITACLLAHPVRDFQLENVYCDSGGIVINNSDVKRPDGRKHYLPGVNLAGTHKGLPSGGSFVKPGNIGLNYNPGYDPCTN